MIVIQYKDREFVKEQMTEEDKLIFKEEKPDFYKRVFPEVINE